MSRSCVDGVAVVSFTAYDDVYLTIWGAAIYNVSPDRIYFTKIFQA